MGIFLFLFLFHLFFLILFAGIGEGTGQEDDCKVRRCGDHGPNIRFPFRLKDEPADCGYPGYDLSCTNNGDTVFEFQFPLKATVKKTDLHLPYYVKASVIKINYKSQQIRVSISYPQHDCLPRQPLNLNSSASPFTLLNYYYYYYYYYSNYYDGYTLFNCSPAEKEISSAAMISCLSGPDYNVYAFRSSYSVSEMDSPTSCTKMYNISSLPDSVFYKNAYPEEIDLGWPKSICGGCEAKGESCRLKKNSTKLETECFQITKPPGDSKKPVLAGEILGPFLLVLVAIALYCVIISSKTKKEDQARIETFLDDYKALKPTRYSYADIKKLTNQFRDKLGEGGFGTVFKGKISDDILVAVKLLNNDSKGNGEEFINEVGTIGTIHHVNVVRLVGYCADGFRRALVYEFLPNNSLEKYVYSGNHNNHFLGWERLQHIALGIAKGIEYLHQGCAQRILHFDIKPHNILLDHNFNPKISDFGLAKLCAKGQSIVSMTAARGTMGYIAPEVFSRNFGNVSSKSDVYSFGMLLLEMVGGRKNINGGAQNTSEVYFPEWIYDRLDKGGELGIPIEKESDNVVSKKLTIVGLWCIRWHPVDRPSMKVVIQMLEGEEIPAMPPNPFASTEQMSTSAATRGRPFNTELEVISESE